MKIFYSISIILFTNFLLIVSCKNKSVEDEKLIEEQKKLNEKTISYKLIDLLVPSIKYQDLKTYIEFSKSGDSIFENNKKQLLAYVAEKDTIYNLEEKNLINILIQNFRESSKIDTAKLSENSKNFLNNTEKHTTRTFTLAFSKFIFNDSLTLACNYLGNYFGDERPRSKLTGGEELIFFEKRNGDWVFKRRLDLIAY